ncbi:fimbrial assembly protein [Deinococcus aquiradiocola]|uniref:PilN biogenesis protein dimerization domain-containing protein n=1 Tax=Deinococcus aquiradiocola TaxID=393059 RepID=A0A917PJG5_9DEIO|nr:fimbrial assembly protein [Deinococcus aquiradiocola]GGJ80503.1 hypothetical protein GCM10008939_25460 [Deinococcus aquiradiocola]
MVEINLLPAQYRKRSDPGLWRYGTLALPLVTLLGVGLFTVIQATRLNNINKDIDAANGQITALEPAKKEYDDLNRQKTDLQKVTEVSSTLQSSKTYWSSDLARFVNALPSGGGVALTNMTVRAVDSNAQTNLSQQGLYNGKAVTKEFDLTGQAASSQSLVNFLNSFENNPSFGVNFKSAQRANAPVGASAAEIASQPYTFTATVGLVGQATPASVTTGTPATGTGTAPGGSDVR